MKRVKILRMFLSRPSVAVDLVVWKLLQHIHKFSNLSMAIYLWQDL